MSSNREEPRIRRIVPEMAENAPAPFDSLACILAEDIRKYFGDPANEAEFQEWQQRRRGA